MAKKLYDISVVNGSYTDVEGNKKNRYTNIGVIMETDDGNSFALIDRSANLAGFPYDESKGNSIVASLFKPNTDGQKQAPKRNVESVSEMTDDIPF
jgi:hypothetical protein